MRKITTLILAIIMVLVIVVTAHAAAQIGATGTTSEGGNTLVFGKSILMKNGNASTVREPNITYTYTISEIGSLNNVTVTDANGYVGTVYKLSEEAGGNFDAVLPNKTATATFADTNTIVTSASGVETHRDLTFDFVGSAFPHAGIYRFVVKETSDFIKDSVGITENTYYSDEMFLDVYVQGQGSDTSIYAYVLFENNDANIAAGETLPARQKSSGWCGGETGTVNQDIYQTYDMEVRKAISGDDTSKNHKFPFTVTLTNANIANKVDLALSSTMAAYPSGFDSTDVSLSSTGTEINANLANQGTLTITGIPVGTTAVIQEKNDTHDFYSLTATIENSTTTSIAAADGSVAPNGGVSTATPAINIDGEIKTRVQFGNNLTTISPTGYVTRYAPYGLILIAGVVLLVIAKKHKKHTDED